MRNPKGEPMATKQAEPATSNGRSGRTRTRDREIGRTRTGYCQVGNTRKDAAGCEGDTAFTTVETVSANARDNWLGSLHVVGLCESDVADLSALLTRLTGAVKDGLLSVDDAGRCMARAVAFAVREHKSGR